MTKSRPALLMVAVLMAAMLTSAPSVAENHRSADAIAAAVMEAMGGTDAWEATRFVRFNFFGSRLHHWDKHTGRHRLEGQSREGEQYVVLHNVTTREGRVFVDGNELEGEEKDAWLERAYSAWINDTYWLFMPYKLTDPGVVLSHDRVETIESVDYDVLRLTFEGVGLTPGDTYWAFINRTTNLMDRWAYFLQDWEDDREPTVWLWTDWSHYGNIVLSPRRFNPADGREAELGEIAVRETLPDSVFTLPEPVVLED